MKSQSNIDIIAEVAESESQLSALTSDDVVDGDERRAFQQGRLDIWREQNNDVKHYRELRTTYAKRVFHFMCWWSISVLVILLVKGFFPTFFILSDIIITTIVGGTTISVVGLVGFMMQGLFHSHGHKEK